MAAPPALASQPTPLARPAGSRQDATSNRLAQPAQLPAQRVAGSEALAAEQPSVRTAAEPTPLWPPTDRVHGDPPGREPGRWRWRRGPVNIHPACSAAGPIERPLASWEPVSVSEACGFAVRFAADYLSWDEREPARRRAALRIYLADPDMAEVGWSGSGRQRADLVTAGRAVILGEGRVVVVEVTARLVMYHRAGDAEGAPPAPSEVPPPLAFAPASAPAPTDPAWLPGVSWWVRIAPPVRRDAAGHLVVDIGLDLTTQS